MPESLSPVSSPDSFPPLLNGLVSKLKHIDGPLPSQIGARSSLFFADQQADQVDGSLKATPKHPGKGSRRVHGSKIGSSPPLHS